MTQHEPIITKIDNRQLNWYGHIMRMDPERMVRKMMEMGKGKEA